MRLVRAVVPFVATVKEAKYRANEGEILEMPDGVDWIEAGLVVPYTAAPGRRERQIETAAIEAPEQAILPPARKKKA